MSEPVLGKSKEPFREYWKSGTHRWDTAEYGAEYRLAIDSWNAAITWAMTQIVDDGNPLVAKERMRSALVP